MKKPKPRKSKKFNPKPLLALIAIVIVAAGAYFFLRGEEKNYPDFTACMAEKGLIEIGSDSCLHCENEKRILGHDAFAQTFDAAGNYLRCNRDPQLCGNLGIRGTPTWYMPSATGKQIDVQGSIYGVHGTYDEYLGELSIAKLAEITKCPLPAGYDPSKAVQAGGYTGS